MEKAQNYGYPGGKRNPGMTGIHGYMGEGYALVSPALQLVFRSVKLDIRWDFLPVDFGCYKQ